MTGPAGAGRPDRERGHERTDAGDPACWLNRVCPECGQFVEDETAARCPRCGADRDQTD